VLCGTHGAHGVSIYMSIFRFADVLATQTIVSAVLLQYRAFHNVLRDYKHL
jgi:hypothetical protein